MRASSSATKRSERVVQRLGGRAVDRVAVLGAVDRDEARPRRDARSGPRRRDRRRLPAAALVGARATWPWRPRLRVSLRCPGGTGAAQREDEQRERDDDDEAGVRDDLVRVSPHQPSPPSCWRSAAGRSARAAARSGGEGAASGASVSDHTGRVRRRLLLLLGLLALAACRSAAAAAQVPLPTVTPTPTADGHARSDAHPGAPAAARLRRWPAGDRAARSPSSPATRSPRSASSCAGAGAGTTRAGPRPSSSTCARWACDPTADWRTLVAGSPARSATFTGEPGALRGRARTRAIGDDAFGPPAARRWSCRWTSATAP